MLNTCLPMQEIWVRSLGWEDPLEEGIETLSNIVAWRIPWTEKPDGLQSTVSQRVRHDRSDLVCKLVHNRYEEEMDGDI